MPDTTSTQIIAAANDEDLRQRLTAMAAKDGIPSPEHWVQLNLHRLVAIDLDGTAEATDTIASIYDYAVATYNPTPRPGANLAAVTDQHISAAIDRVQAAPAGGGQP